MLSRNPIISFPQAQAEGQGPKHPDITWAVLPYHSSLSGFFYTRRAFATGDDMPVEVEENHRRSIDTLNPPSIHDPEKTNRVSRLYKHENFS